MIKQRPQKEAQAITLKDVLKGHLCYFDRFQNNNFYYNVRFQLSENEVSYQFQIPAEIVKDRPMLSIEKVHEFALHVAKSIENKTFIKTY